jgi:hypothetical protein
MNPKHLSFLTSVAVTVACAAIALTVGIATATAGGGNSANAKKCQKSGWQTLVTSTGATFSTEEDCTSYGAGGGVFYPLASAPCLNDGWQAPAQRSDGTGFSSQADCLSYTGANGVVYKPSLNAEPSTVKEGENVAISASGFHPNSTGQLTIVTLPINVSSTLLAVTNATGGFTGGSTGFDPGACALGYTGVQLTYVDGSGVHASAAVTLDCA